MHASRGVRSFGGPLALIIVAGCAAIGGPTQSAVSPGSSTPTGAMDPISTGEPTPSAGPTATVPPTPSPLPTSAVYGPVTVVDGVSTFVSGDMGTVTTDPAGAQHARGGLFVFREETNDPRVNGTHTVSGLAMDYWGDPGRSNGAIVQWGDERIVNDGGSWEGWGSGIYSTDRGTSSRSGSRGVAPMPG